MSDMPDNPFILDAYYYGGEEPTPEQLPPWSSPFNKLNEIDFDNLRFFNLESKGYFAPEIQPHSVRLELPPKDVADYRLIFRPHRIQAHGGAQGMFLNNMLPANIEIGCERCTEENKDTLIRFERGEVVEPWKEYYPLQNGFRMMIYPTMDIATTGNLLSRTVLEESVLCTYLKPKVI